MKMQEADQLPGYILPGYTYMIFISSWQHIAYNFIKDVNIKFSS